jgi:hypothetical protein
MRVLEISRFGLFKSLMPDSTDWIRWGDSLTADEPVRPQQFSLGLLLRTLNRMRRREFDLIVLPAIHPQHLHGEPRFKRLAKSVLARISTWPTLVALLSRAALGPAKCIILDIHDGRDICLTAVRLFPQFSLYFKRELDREQHPDIELRRKLRAMPLILPDERSVPRIVQKDIDLVFIGKINSEIRSMAVHSARRLRAHGLRVVIPDDPLPYPIFMETLARSWLALSPEGEGWDCYRHYEACLAASVPLINRPRYRRVLYLEHGRHCFYYDADRDSLDTQVVTLLADKPALVRIGHQGRRHVLRHHTRAALARHMLNELGYFDGAFRDAWSLGQRASSAAPGDASSSFRLGHDGRVYDEHDHWQPVH